MPFQAVSLCVLLSQEGNCPCPLALAEATGLVDPCTQTSLLITEICILNVPVGHEKYIICENCEHGIEYFPHCLRGQVTHTTINSVVILAHIRATLHCKAGAASMSRAGQCSHHSTKKQAFTSNNPIDNKNTCRKAEQTTQIDTGWLWRGDEAPFCKADFWTGTLCLLCHSSAWRAFCCRGKASWLSESQKVLSTGWTRWSWEVFSNLINFVISGVVSPETCTKSNQTWATWFHQLCITEMWPYGLRIQWTNPALCHCTNIVFTSSVHHLLVSDCWWNRLVDSHWNKPKFPSQ